MKERIKVVRGLFHPDNKSFEKSLNKALEKLPLSSELVDIKYSTIKQPELDKTILFTALIIYIP